MINIAALQRRALFLRRTDPINFQCRGDNGTWQDSDGTSDAPSLLALAWQVGHDEPLLPGSTPESTCGAPECLVHLDLDLEAKHLQLAARPSMDMRAVFRRGLKRGLFKSVGTYK